MKGLHVLEKHSTGECSLESYINKTLFDRRTREIDFVYCGVYYLPVVSLKVAFGSQDQDKSY